MPIRVKKVSDDLYLVSATPPDVDEEWSPTEQLSGRELTRILIEKGGHQQDIGDAMYDADPMWVEKLRDPYIPPSERH